MRASIVESVHPVLPKHEKTTFCACYGVPSETVSFSLPPGGFKNQPEPKTKSLNSQIDELFSQYYPAVNTDLEDQLSTAQVVEAVVDLILHQTLQLAEQKNTENQMALETTPGKTRKRKRPENLGRSLLFPLLYLWL